MFNVKIRNIHNNTFFSRLGPLNDIVSAFYLSNNYVAIKHTQENKTNKLVINENTFNDMIYIFCTLSLTPDTTASSSSSISFSQSTTTQTYTRITDVN